MEEGMPCEWEEEGKEMVENQTSLHLVPRTGHSPKWVWDFVL
jgi:hypothetical protein